MVILTQKKVLINADTIRDIYVDNGEVVAEFCDHSEIILGKYVNWDRAYKMVEKIGESFNAITLFKMED